MKISLLFFLGLSISETTLGQNEYEKFFQALMKGDTVLAAQIEKRSAHTTELIQEKLFRLKNVPEHVFNVNIDRIKDSIVTFFTIENQLNNKFLNAIFYNYISLNNKSKKIKSPIVFKAETISDSVFGGTYFSKPNTSNDIYIHDYGFTWFSKLYFSKGRPLEFRTPFIIKLSKLSDDSTDVKVVADDPRVINGTSGFGPHGPIARETTVKPSSIEEYSILLFIADKLGQHHLLKLKLPDPK